MKGDREMKYVINAIFILLSLSIAVLIGMDSINIGLYAVLILAEYMAVLCLNPAFRKALKHFFIRKGSFGEENKYYGAVHLETLEEDMEKIEPIGFEHFVADLFKARGYQTKVTAAKKDFGGDVLAKKGDKFFVIQVKHREKGDWSVSNDAVQQAVAAMPVYKANASMVVTNGIFTGHACKQADFCNTYLIDGAALKEMIRDVIDGKSQRQANAVEEEQSEEASAVLPVVLEEVEQVKLEDIMNKESIEIQTVEEQKEKVDKVIKISSIKK